MSEMRPEYQDYINKNFPTFAETYGKCQEASEAMKLAFPELTIVKGYVWAGAWGKRGHWWLVDENGGIVDPTAKQFTSGVGSYEPWVPGSEVRVGKCMNCGDEIWESLDSLEDVKIKSICSEECADDFQKYLEWECEGYPPRHRVSTNPNKIENP